MSIKGKTAGVSAIEADDYIELSKEVNRLFADLSDGAVDAASFVPGSNLACRATLDSAIAASTPNSANQRSFDLIGGHGVEEGDFLAVFVDGELINEEKSIAQDRRSGQHRYVMDLSQDSVTLKTGFSAIPSGAEFRVYRREAHIYGWGGEACAELPASHNLPDDDRRVLTDYANGLIRRARIMNAQLEVFGGWSEWKDHGNNAGNSAGASIPSIRDFSKIHFDGSAFGFFGRKDNGTTPNGRPSFMSDSNDGAFAAWTESGGDRQHLIAAYGWEENLGGVAHQSRTRSKSVSVDSTTAIAHSSADDEVTVTHASHGFETGEEVSFLGLELASADSAKRELLDDLDGRTFTLTSADGSTFAFGLSDGPSSDVSIAAGDMDSGSMNEWGAWEWSTESESSEYLAKDLSHSASAAADPRAILLRDGLTTPIATLSGPPYAILIDWPVEGTKKGQRVSFVIDGKKWTADRRLVAQDDIENVDDGDEIRLVDKTQVQAIVDEIARNPHQSRGAIIDESAVSTTRSAQWGGKTNGEYDTMQAVFEVEFGSYSEARHFFNRGGEITLKLSSNQETSGAMKKLLDANAKRTMSGKSHLPFVRGTESGFYSLHGDAEIWVRAYEYDNAQNGLCRISHMHRTRSRKFVYSIKMELGHPSVTDVDVKIECGYKNPSEVRSDGLRLRGGTAPSIALSESLVDADSFNVLANLTNRIFADLHEGSAIPAPYAFKTKKLAEVDMSVTANVRSDRTYAFSQGASAGEFIYAELGGSVIDAGDHSISGNSIILDASINARQTGADTHLRVYAQGTQMYGWGQTAVNPLVTGNDAALRQGYNAVIDRVNIMLGKSGIDRKINNIGIDDRIDSATDELIRSRLNEVMLDETPHSTLGGTSENRNAASITRRGSFSKADATAQWEFSGYAEARHFFNAGGALTIQPVLEDNDVDSWNVHFNTVDRYSLYWNRTVQHRKNERPSVTGSKGFYHLTATAQELDDSPFKLNGKVELAPDGRFRIIASIEFEDSERLSSTSALSVNCGHSIPKSETQGDVEFSIATPSTTIVDPL